MTDWKEWFEKYKRSVIWGDLDLNSTDKCGKNVITIEDQYQAFKARMIAEQSWIMPRLEQIIKDNEAREKIRAEAESEK